MEVATVGGGCFWCLEAVYIDLIGVQAVQSGYAGGQTHDPTYEEVCGGTTGHAEVVQLRFDPEVITFREILEVFFAVHDPTTPNRQGADVGTQYRSIILHHTPDQREISEEVIRDLDGQDLWSSPIVTEVSPIGDFYPAEDYHDDYFRKNPHQPYCRAVINPKVAQFRTRFAHKLKRTQPGKATL
jgi:peptide-methionine (S)-S-oxide reductase